MDKTELVETEEDSITLQERLEIMWKRWSRAAFKAEFHRREVSLMWSVLDKFLNDQQTENLCTILRFLFREEDQAWGNNKNSRIDISIEKKEEMIKVVLDGVDSDVQRFIQDLTIEIVSLDATS